MSKIVQVGTPVLYATAEPVALQEFNTIELQTILTQMKEALAGEEDGAAIAAPQIGVAKRIFVIAERVFGPMGREYGSSDPHFIFINPTITKLSKKKDRMDEGCLSVRGKYGTVRRAVRATVEAYDEQGQKFSRGAGGLLAQVFQHECDHLDGTLFTDRALEVWDVEYPKK